MIFNIDSLNNPELNNLRNIFVSKGFDMRFVGGCVRDLLSGREPKDIDLCTDADPQEQARLYREAGVRYIESGVDHGTITVVLNGQTYEITSLRLDVSTDGRRATVKYTKDWLKDLARRDFTMNAMSLTFDGVLIDPFDGFSDLKQGMVRFVGNADERIKEDYLRILRWYRFRGRVESKDTHKTFIHPDTKAVMNNAAGLKQISKERVWSEIKKIVCGPNGPHMMMEIHQHQLAKHIDLPGSINWISHAEDLHARTKNPVSIMCSLYGERTTYDILKTWKASNDEMMFARFLNDSKGSNGLNFMLAVSGERRDWVVELARVRNYDPFEVAVLQEWPIPVFPVNGFDLIAAGIKPGPQYNEILNELKILWSKRGYAATKEELLSLIDFSKYT